MPKSPNNLKFSPVFIIPVLLLLILGFAIGTLYQYKKDKAGVCGVAQHNLTVVIQKERFKPAKIRAKRCDKLTFINKDNKMHSVVFGTHDQHIPYGDFIQEYLQPKERFSLRLSQSGTFQFHDHLHEEMTGQLVID